MDATGTILSGSYYVMMGGSLMLVVAATAPLVIYSASTEFKDSDKARTDAVVSFIALLIGIAMTLAFIITLSIRNAVLGKKYNCSPNTDELQKSNTDMAWCGIAFVLVGAVMVLAALVDMVYTQDADFEDNDNRLTNYGYASLSLSCIAIVSALACAGAIGYSMQNSRPKQPA